MNDLFSQAPATSREYTARDIEVLEGLDPVRRRPGMYVGATDENGLHHLAAEVLDNAMDEAVAGHATRIAVRLAADGALSVEDNGRGIPVDAHPRYKDRSALEVILTTLHAGAKFADKVYHTAGGLHGVGVSVVNALSVRLDVEVARDRRLWTQSFRRGKPVGRLQDMGEARRRRGTRITFWPDPKIFGTDAVLRPARLYRMARSKAYLFRGVEIRWSCDPALAEDAAAPASCTLHFPGGLSDYLAAALADRETVTPAPFAARGPLPHDAGHVEWAVAWPLDTEGFLSSYANTVPTPEGGTHVQGLRSAFAKGLKAHGELVGNRRAAAITQDDAVGAAAAVLSVFVREPQFHGQTKERLAGSDVARAVEGVLRDHFDHWLGGAPDVAGALLDHVVERAETRLRRKQDKEVARKSATRRLRLPGKLADCVRAGAEGTELLLVEGDSAGGTAKQARDRNIQAVLPLRGKILNVASAGADKLHGNQEIANLLLALGCGTGDKYRGADVRYERVVIMTDADVDGAHIASLLMTFFYRRLPGLIDEGRLYLACPPLYRLTRGGRTAYARDDAHKDELLAAEFGGKGKVEISRFKGLGEMPAAQLKATTVDPARRTLLRVLVGADREPQAAALVEQLMGRKPEFRLRYIQKHAPDARNLDV